MSLSRLEYLFDLYVRQQCSDQEEDELMLLIDEPENEALLQKLIDRVIENTGDETPVPDSVAASVLENILRKDVIALPGRRKSTGFAPLLRVAAVALLLLSSAAAYRIFVTPAGADEKSLPSADEKALILPGSSRAWLTMADGTRIQLDSAQNRIIQQGKTKINKQGGLLVYETAGSSMAEPQAMNTLSTPRGGQFQLLLPDGSRVWLNASSSLTFPTAFTGKIRQVELTGEAYFEVVKNRQKPFLVKTAGMQVNVLGTHFDVNAYGDENNIKTSLLEGAVKISSGVNRSLLAPGEQAVLDKKENSIEIKNADMEEVMAWKNGLFQFHDAGISSIMQQIGRWYDVEIIYRGKIPVRSFEGKISRHAQLAEVLQILELSNVRFTVEGKKIIVQ